MTDKIPQPKPVAPVNELPIVAEPEPIGKLEPKKLVISTPPPPVSEPDLIEESIVNNTHQLLTASKPNLTIDESRNEVKWIVLTVVLLIMGFICCLIYKHFWRHR